MVTLPLRFRERYREQFGSSELDALEVALERPLVSAIRFHPTEDRGKGKLRSVPWSSTGYYVDQATTFGADPLWYAGLYYVQEPAAMFVEQFLSQLALQPTTALDLCAAPGGKSTILRSLIPDTSLLVANEPEPKRAKILAENLLRWGLDETIITSTYPDHLARSGITFELILVDAPCSGEGMFRKEPQAVTEWSEANVAQCVRRQREILDAAWQMLQPGGTLIYSTCTFNLEENEEQLLYLQKQYNAQLLQVETEPQWGIQHSTGVYRFAPHHTESEGLSLFAVRKALRSDSTHHQLLTTESTSTPTRSKGKASKSGNPQGLSLPGEVCIHALEMLQQPEQSATQIPHPYLLSPLGETYRRRLSEARIRLLSCGIPLGQAKGRDFIPHTALALAKLHHAELHYPTLSLSPSEALTYLRGEALTIPNAPKGILLLTFEGTPLGFAKSLPNRINNLYPKELRLRSNSFTTNDIPTLF